MADLRDRMPSRVMLDEDTIREQINHLYKIRGGHAADVTRNLREFYDAVERGAPVEHSSVKFENLNKAFSKFEESHVEFMNLAADRDKEKVMNSEKQFDETLEKMQSAKDSFGYLQNQDDGVRPEDSVSCVSNQSIKSSATSAMAKATARKAMLVSKAQYLKKQMDIESSKFEMEQSLKRLQLESEIEAASIEENILSNYVKHKTNTTNVKKSVLNPKAREWVGSTGHSEHPQNDSVNFETKIENTPSPSSADNEQFMQRHLLDAVSLPKMRLMTFDGNPIDYWVFMNAFDSCVGHLTVGDGVKLSRLFEYCEGRAAQVIKPCMIMNPKEGYARARKLLKERFGNNYRISEAWVKKITDGPVIRPNNGQALQDLSDDVRGCIEALKAMNMSEEIDSRCRMVKIVERLPFHVQARWRRDAFRCLNRTEKYPNIVEFATFLETVTNEMLDPVFGSVGDRYNEQRAKPSLPKRYDKGGSSFSVQVSHSTSLKDKQREARTESGVSKAKYSVKCFLCNGNHQMHNCEKFLAMSPVKRLDAVLEYKLCFNCLEFRNHTAKLCRFSGKCDVENCQQKHSKLLHSALIASSKDNIKGASSASAGVTSRQRFETRQTGERAKVEAHSCACGKSETESSKVCLPIVTVHVRGGNQGEFVRTNALLDPGSNKTFCSKELVAQLGLKGKSTTLTLKTLNDGKESVVEEVSLEVMSTIGKRKNRKIIHLPKVYALDDFPALTGSVASSSDISTWDHLKGIQVPQTKNIGVTLLIGQDIPQGLSPLEVRAGRDGDPYAIRTALGWTINGPLGTVCEQLIAVSHFTHVKTETDVGIEKQLEQFWKIDTGPVLAGSMPQLSVDDQSVIRIWDTSVKHSKRHYELDIPFKTDSPDLPDNGHLALKRLQYLGKRFKKDPDLHQRYAAEISTLLKQDYAEIVPQEENSIVEGRIWYLPHHAVKNPNKPDKLRVVFDCAAEFDGVSLNKRVLQGPDMTNKLLGVLLRFREGRVAIMGDIEAMFYQVKVSPEHRDVLRFLWWKDGDISQEPTVYRMTVHPFGGVWSPSCASYVLRRTAEDNANAFDPETIRTVLDNFYVDDCLKSIDTEERAVKLIRELCQLTLMGGFRLTKWVSNSRSVIESIPIEERAKEVKELELHSGSLPIERALGVHWDTESDCLGIRSNQREANYTRRGLLSITSSVYDPLGFISPFVLQAKKIFQSECRMNKSWDDELSDENKRRWSKWLQELPKIQEFKLDRCVLPVNFGSYSKVELHHFCDASQEAYGAVSYIRFINDEGNIHCAFLLGKSRLAPIQHMSVPRLELSAAVVAVRMSSMLNKELSIVVDSNLYWSDSMIVLQYVKNKTKRFHTFVANRVAIIHDGSSPECWRYVDTKSNPADDASRGLNALEMVSRIRWQQGPEFLWEDESKWPRPTTDLPDLLANDKEVKLKSLSCAVEAEPTESPTDLLMSYYSSWHRLKKAVAWLLKFTLWLKNRVAVKRTLSVEDIAMAEKAIVIYLQRGSFREELSCLKSTRAVVSKKSHIYDLEPILDTDGILRVGGRLLAAPIPESAKCPVILPRDHHVTSLIVRHVHEWEAKHSGREYVLALIRQKYWIPKCRPLINRILRLCWTCKRLRAIPGSQRMAALPVDRVSPSSPPFTCAGVDCFGPFFVKRGRSQEKRYGCLFTCLSIRAIHIEKLHSMDADSFINALIRFISRRGRPERIRSDNGTNFVGGKNELDASIKQWNEHTRIRECLLLQGIKWDFNPPSASHMGGVWERQIRSVRKVLNAVLKDQVLDDERLDTVFCEVEAIVNARPITYVSDNPKDPEPLTPNHLLLLRSNQTVPPGLFRKQDCYGRRWRHAQYLADQFWKRWLYEYLPTLQFRKKWIDVKENFKEGDIVLVMDENTPRMNWPLGRVVEVFPGKDRLVRSVKVKTRSTELVRPVHKLCHLESASSE